MPVTVLGRGTVVPEGGLQEGEAEARAARAALASARIEASKVDTVVAPSSELAAKVAGMVGIPNASAVGCSGENGTAIELAAALVEKETARIVLAVEAVTAGQGPNEARGGVAAIVTKARAAAPLVTRMKMHTLSDEANMSWRPAPPLSKDEDE